MLIDLGNGNFKEVFVITFQQQKGGVGKTTIAIHFAMRAANLGLKVRLIDQDPQGSVLEWSERRKGTPPFQVVGVSKPVLHRDIAMYASDVDIVIIDGIGKSSASSQSAIASSDLCVIPVQPSPYDVWSSHDTISLANEAKVINDKTKLAFLLNAVVATTQISKTVKKALDESGIFVLKATVGRRVSFVNSATQGMTALETESGGKAALEIITLFDEIIKEFAPQEIQRLALNERGFL